MLVEPDRDPLVEGRHFVQAVAEEEAPDGFYEGIRQQAPESAGALARLAEDHQAILRQAMELTRRAKACLEGPVAEALSAASALVEHIEAQATAGKPIGFG